MSLATWKAKFYPKPANRTRKREALSHSLRKWKGLTRAGLRKHKLTQCVSEWTGGNSITDGTDSMFVGYTACALCVHYYQDGSETPCLTCPLALARGGVSCYEETPEEIDAPWIMFLDHGDARPMIRALQKAVRNANR